MALEDAIKTMRKTCLYGKDANRGSRTRIEWPKVNDLLQMSNNIPIKIRDFEFKISTNYPSYFGAFQVILSNGMISPVFNVNENNDQDIQSLNITEYSLVKRVNGT
jgi:hypothetical protein